MKLVIVDTWGEQPLHPNLVDRLPIKSLQGFTPDKFKGYRPHGHGSWCLWDCLSQFNQPVDVYMVQRFGPNGENIPDSVWMDAVADIGLTPEDLLNGSWGGDDDGGGESYYEGIFKPRFKEILNGAKCMMATGNDGRREQSYPQVFLVGEPNIYIVASVNHLGVTSKFSCTAKINKRYPDFAFFGENGLSIDGNTGQILAWQGTSKSAPNALGAFGSLEVPANEVRDYARKLVLEDTDRDGNPNGIHRDYRSMIAAGGYHHEVGIGVIEDLRQIRMRDTKKGLGAFDMDGSVLNMAPMYHDFDRLEI